jgi:hypothetical protein
MLMKSTTRVNILSDINFASGYAHDFIHVMLPMFY